MKNKEPKKIGRIGYLVTIIFLMIVVFIFFAVIGYAMNDEDFMGLAILFLLTVVFIFLFNMTRHRLSDINLPKGLSFVLLIPTVNVVFIMVLCFLPSDLISDNIGRNNNRSKKVNKDSRRHNESGSRPKKYKRVKAKAIQSRRKEEPKSHESQRNTKVEPGYNPKIEHVKERIHKAPVREMVKQPTKIQPVGKSKANLVKTKPAIRPKIQPVKTKPVIRKEDKNINTISLNDFIKITAISSERAAQILKVRDKAGRLISAYDLSLRLEITPEERKIIETKLEFKL